MRRLLLVLLALALLGLGLSRLVAFRAELTDLLPPARGPATTFLLGELRNGAATTLMLAAIEGAPERELARLSRDLGEALRQSGRFSFVGNGAQDFSEAERDLLFRYRYLLSAATAPPLFEAPALRAGMERLLAGLRSAAAPLVARFGFADPAGVFLDTMRGWLGESRVELRHGVWFAGTGQEGAGQEGAGQDGAGPPRALLLARLAGTGSDTEAQAAAMAVFHEAFARAGPGEARLLLSGPGVFAAEAAAAVRADVEMIALLSGLLILGFLLWRFRSALVLAAVAVPLLAGMLAGLAAVAAWHGAVHGAAFGFGMTMLGVVVDYPLLLLGQRRPKGEGEEEAVAGAARRIAPSLLLAAGSAALGLTAMLASDVPLLRQLGLFGAAGLLAGVAVTRWLLPGLLPATPPPLRPLPGPVLAALAPLRGRRRLLLAAPLAGLALLATGGPRWEDDLARLSPVPEAQRALDAELRGQLGAPDVNLLVAFTAPDAEAVLRLSERIDAALAPLVARGALAGFDSPSRYLPSAATQRARQAALPAPESLRARLAEAAAGLPFRPDAFRPFLDGLAESRALPPLTVADLAAAPVLAARLSPMLAPRGAAWQGLVIPAGVRDPAALRQALTALGEPAILFIDVKAETTGLVLAASREALFWAAAGALGVLALLALGLRGGGPLAALRRGAPILAALLVTLAALALLDQRLTPFHLAALLLSAGVGIDYALFLARPARDPAEARRGLEAVLTCAVTTLLTFGLLALCATPVLRGIGLTVAIGVTAAFLLSLALAPRPAR